MVLSFRQGSKQKLLEAEWNQEHPPKSAVYAVLAMLDQLGLKWRSTGTIVLQVETSKTLRVTQT